MKKFTLPYFGDLDLSEHEEYFEADVTIDECSFSIAIDFEGKKPTEEALNSIKEFLSELTSHIQRTESYINQGFSKPSGFVSEYISYFKEAIEENGDIDEYVNKNNSDESIEKQLLGKLYLLRIGIYPYGGAFAILDYTLDESYTDDLLVIYLTSKGEPDGMAIES